MTQGGEGGTAAVLSSYPAVLRGRPEAPGTHGGFSGARLWKVHTAAGPLCLRAAAPAEAPGHLRERHRLMRLARGAGLTFVPAVLATVHGDCVVEHAGRWWELMEWMPGVADYRDHPSEARLRAAAQGLARLHVAWRGEGGMSPRCPAVVRRLDAAAAWTPGPLLRSVANPRLAGAVDRWMPLVPELLRDVSFPVRLQPCLRDVWHDHLLFEGDRLTGLVDYAAAGMDSVAADLARMLGSLVADDDEGWQVGLAAYREVAALSIDEERLARRLDRTGVIVALANWLRRLAEEGGAIHEQAGQRVEGLLARVDSWRSLQRI